MYHTQWRSVPNFMVSKEKNFLVVIVTELWELLLRHAMKASVCGPEVKLPTVNIAVLCLCRTFFNVIKYNGVQIYVC